MSISVLNMKVAYKVSHNKSDMNRKVTNMHFWKLLLQVCISNCKLNLQYNEVELLYLSKEDVSKAYMLLFSSTELFSSDLHLLDLRRIFIFFVITEESYGKSILIIPLERTIQSPVINIRKTLSITSLSVCFLDWNNTSVIR